MLALSGAGVLVADAEDVPGIGPVLAFSGIGLLVTGILEDRLMLKGRKQKMPRVLGGLALVRMPWSLPVRTRGKV